MTYKRTIIILADGARPDVLKEEMDKGNLPILKKYFDEQGTNKTMLTCFPSTTGPAYLPYVTGCFPGTCNVPGIRWFDKVNFQHRSYCGLETFMINKDARPVETIFHRLPKAYNIFNAVCVVAGSRLS